MRCLKPYDVFLSHVAEDWDIVNPLVSALREAGFRVWYSHDHLQPGESILPEVEKGLKRSRFCIVVLSQAYVNSSWATYELFTTIARKNGNKPVCIPVWHDISSEQIRRHYPVNIVDLYGISTKHGIEQMMVKLKHALASHNRICAWISLGCWLMYKYAKKVKQVLAIAAIICIAAAIQLYIGSLFTPDTIAHPCIRTHIAKADRLCKVKGEAIPDSSMDRLIDRQEEFGMLTTPGGNRQQIFFINAGNVSSPVTPEQLELSPDRATLTEHFGIPSYAVYIGDTIFTSEMFIMDYTVRNEEPVQYKVISTELGNDDECRITVQYSAFIRCVEVNCNYIYKMRSRLQTIKYKGLPPVETFVFKKKDGDWKLVGIN
jgi:hypothetical protein